MQLPVWLVVAMTFAGSVRGTCGSERRGAFVRCFLCRSLLMFRPSGTGESA